MRRNGFTMVELIFVIIIIGILSVAAIPKFGDIKDRAKIATEYATLSSLDSVIEGLFEFQKEDFNNIEVNWHEYQDMGDTTGAHAGRDAHYKMINDNKQVLKKIIKKGDKLRVAAYGYFNSAGIGNNLNDGLYYDILFIEGEASSAQFGIEKKVDAAGKPDKNDFWAFNTSTFDINITGNNIPTVTLLAGEMQLIDVNGTVTLNYGSDDADIIGVTNAANYDVRVVPL